ncbi:basic leucine zipper 4 [Punica granatum]|uniref:BZIP domain-containing protein n=2 Tax=Punica granatum TaxID=22663 RepID=A0A218X7E6_PUNGR|nr:basic leucine zipper 4 [Punica granatum]OWM80619.1 hypothetical protein CDL15_Pgr006649 [Punica granatum]PKI72465.1 hypothetical protein CRG98_007132 [Punica granatum]
MLCPQEAPVHLQLPVLETGFTPDELQELLSFLNQPTSPNSGSEGSNRSVGSMDDERKRRRMISNRESARRSRWRKKRHLEDLTEQLNRFTVENRQLKNQLSHVINRCHVVRTENERLRSECIALLARLSDLCQILVNMKLIQ